MRGPRGAPESLPDLRTSLALLDPSASTPLPSPIPSTETNPTIPAQLRPLYNPG